MKIFDSQATKRDKTHGIILIILMILIIINFVMVRDPKDLILFAFVASNWSLRSSNLQLRCQISEQLEGN